MIDWWDHTGDSSWFAIEDIEQEQPVLCRTVGYLVAENEEVYKLVDTITNDKGYGGLSIILKSCVKDIWVVEF
jgi:hypothetical protein